MLSQTHVSTMVKASFGYLDPEYFHRQQWTDKSDVYSFGAVIFKFLCWRLVLNPSLPKDQVSLTYWALFNYSNGTIDIAIDHCAVVGMKENQTQTIAVVNKRIPMAGLRTEGLQDKKQ